MLFPDNGPPPDFIRLIAANTCERTDDVRADEYLGMRPCALGLRCVDGDQQISIEYDCAAGRFVRKVVQK